MPIFIICALLISSVALAEEPTKYHNQFLLVPVEKCNNPKDESTRDLCSKILEFPGDITKFKLAPGTEGQASVQLRFDQSTEADDMELLCYRCSLKKVPQVTCGRYKTIWGDAAWAKQCPNHK